MECQPSAEWLVELIRLPTFLSCYRTSLDLITLLQLLTDMSARNDLPPHGTHIPSQDPSLAPSPTTFASASAHAIPLDSASSDIDEDLTEGKEALGEFDVALQQSTSCSTSCSTSLLARRRARRRQYPCLYSCEQSWARRALRNSPARISPPHFDFLAPSLRLSNGRHCLQIGRAHV